MELYEKMVEYEKWCPKCIHFKELDWKDACNDCLNNPFNDFSHKPINFKEKETKNERESAE